MSEVSNSMKPFFSCSASFNWVSTVLPGMSSFLPYTDDLYSVVYVAAHIEVEAFW